MLAFTDWKIPNFGSTAYIPGDDFFCLDKNSESGIRVCLKLKASVVWTSRSCGSFHFIPWGTPRTLAAKDHLGSFHFTSYVTSKDNWLSHSGIKIKSQHISLDIFRHIWTIASLVQGSGTCKNKSYFTFLLHQLLPL